MNSYLEPSHQILSSIFKEKSYSTIALSKQVPNDAVTKIVYGVLERNTELDFIIKSLCDKKPQLSIEIVLKIAIYCLLYMDVLPDYAVVNETVELTKKLGKREVSGFVNAVLKKVCRREYKLPTQGEKGYLSIKNSKPQWFVDKLISQFGLDTAKSILEEPIFEKEHIRVNTKLTTLAVIKATLKAQGIDVEQSAAGGLIVRNTAEVKEMFNTGLVTYQSPSSMLAVKALGVTNGATVLDICAAPGGKSVLIAEQNPNTKVVACDLYPHRVELIASYKNRMNVKNVEEQKADATKFIPDFENAFDFVLVDAPCSCFGTFRKHQDVFMQHSLSSIHEMSKLQSTILENAKRYVKPDGILLYSTCTLFDEENKTVVSKFLKANSNFKLEKMNIPYENNGTLSLLPKEEWDGFYIARMRKNND
ncbi:MAG TPA: 16S rRNA (cytosine(967)-C(5))-methyltransferase RsmB [Clostridia bacterium]|nr:16S rRNA (cytosine(967)-C(5))-methyltransferase RsmB [Clostridia bacterium]